MSTYGLAEQQEINVPAADVATVRVVQGKVLIVDDDASTLVDAPAAFKIADAGTLHIRAVTGATVYLSPPEAEVKAKVSKPKKAAKKTAAKPKAKSKKPKAAAKKDADPTHKELRALAAKQKIKGRGKMSKAELVKALA